MPKTKGTDLYRLTRRYISRKGVDGFTEKRAHAIGEIVRFPEGRAPSSAVLLGKDEIKAMEAQEKREERRRELEAELAAEEQAENKEPQSLSELEPTIGAEPGDAKTLTEMAKKG